MSIPAKQLVLPWRVAAGTPSIRTLEKRVAAARRKAGAKRKFKSFLWRKGFSR